VEQRPEPGLEPYDPPSAELARAYLDESTRVAQRREERIDRRAAARLLLIDGAVFGVYLITLMLCFTPSGDLNVMVILVPFLIWTQLAATLREEYGYQRRGREQRLRTAVVLIILVMLVGGLTAAFLDLGIPFWLRVLPGILSFLMYGALAWDEWRRAAAVTTPRIRTPFTRAVRVTTIVMGVALGATIGSVASTALVAAVVVVLVMLALAAWMLTSLVAGGSPLATAWGVFHWTCFALSGAVVVALVLVGQFTDVPLETTGYVAGGAIALAFVIGAVRERKNA
jgi:MFS family permease